MRNFVNNLKINSLLKFSFKTVLILISILHNYKTYTILEMKAENLLMYFIQTLIISLIVIVYYPSSLNNACKNYTSYLNIHHSSDCFYISDADKNILDVIKYHTNVSESHEVTTADGYILGLFRIPRKNPKGVLLFQHGLAEDARYWVAQSNESIAFMFWKAGYDVWLGNSRGTFFSRKHTSLTDNEEQFWNYSFHEMGYYDLPATIDYIKLKTGADKIIYLGYSMGTATSMVYASTRQEASTSVKLIVHLAPFVCLKYVTSPIAYFFKYVNLAERYNLHKILKWYNIASYNSWYLKFGRIINRFFPFKKIVVYFISFLVGWTPDESDPKYANIMIDQFGSANSFKTYHHFSQILNSQSCFHWYDYGRDNNLDLYGSAKPPLYRLENVTIPIFILHSQDDTLSHPQDVQLFFEKLPQKTKMYGKTMVGGINHHNYFFGRHRNDIYYRIIELLKNV